MPLQGKNASNTVFYCNSFASWLLDGMYCAGKVARAGCAVPAWFSVTTFRTKYLDKWDLIASCPAVWLGGFFFFFSRFLSCRLVLAVKRHSTDGGRVFGELCDLVVLLH